jgi:hypothetical protein
MATQLSVIRGDTFPVQTVSTFSSVLDFTNMTCTGQLRTHPDGNLLYQFIPTVVSGLLGTGVVTYSIPSSATKTFPPLNLYGDIHYYLPTTGDRTLHEFRLNVVQDVTQL